MLVLPLFRATGGILLQMAPPSIPTTALNKCLRQVVTFSWSKCVLHHLHIHLFWNFRFNQIKDSLVSNLFLGSGVFITDPILGLGGDRCILLTLVCYLIWYVNVSLLNIYSVQISAREDVMEVSQARFWELVPGYVVGSLIIQVIYDVFSFPLSILVLTNESKTWNLISYLLLGYNICLDSHPSNA